LKTARSWDFLKGNDADETFDKPSALKSPIYLCFQIQIGYNKQPKNKKNHVTHHRLIDWLCSWIYERDVRDRRRLYKGNGDGYLIHPMLPL